jgi:GNAT superfamily N-acetyltransferase
MVPAMGVSIRRATAADRGTVVPLSSRLHDFGPPDWRDRATMDEAVAPAISGALDASGPETEVLVAEDSAGRTLGFVHLHEATDFFTGEVHGHVSDIVVRADAEGRGVGRALMDAGEQWSRDRGHRLLTLNVFEKNRRARGLYERLGFSADTTKLVKVLRPI